MSAKTGVEKSRRDYGPTSDDQVSRLGGTSDNDGTKDFGNLSSIVGRAKVLGESLWDSSVPNGSRDGRANRTTNRCPKSEDSHG